MNRQKLFVLFIGVFVLLLVTGFELGNATSFGTSYAASEAVVVGPVVGLKAPDFTLPDLNGQKTVLSKVIKSNKITVVNFWATWCPPCKKEIPDLISFYRKYNTKKVGFLGIDLQESLSDVKKFVQQNKMNYPVLTDTNATAAQLYNVYVIPTTFFIDRNGKIVDMIQGGASLKTLESKVLPFLK